MAGLFWVIIKAGQIFSHRGPLKFYAKKLSVFQEKRRTSPARRIAGNCLHLQLSAILGGQAFFRKLGFRETVVIPH